MMQYTPKSYEVLASKEKKLKSLFIRLQRQPEKKGNQWCLRVGLDAYVWWRENSTSDDLLKHLPIKKGDLFTVGEMEYTVHTVRPLQAIELDVAEAFESGLIKELPLGWANGLKGNQIHSVVKEFYETYDASTPTPLDAMDWFMLVGLEVNNAH